MFVSELSGRKTLMSHNNMHHHYSKLEPPTLDIDRRMDAVTETFAEAGPKPKTEVPAFMAREPQSVFGTPALQMSDLMDRHVVSQNKQSVMPFEQKRERAISDAVRVMPRSVDDIRSLAQERKVAMPGRVVPGQRLVATSDRVLEGASDREARGPASVGYVPGRGPAVAQAASRRAANVPSTRDAVAVGSMGVARIATGAPFTNPPEIATSTTRQVVEGFAPMGNAFTGFGPGAAGIRPDLDGGRDRTVESRLPGATPTHVAEAMEAHAEDPRTGSTSAAARVLTTGNPRVLGNLTGDAKPMGVGQEHASTTLRETTVDAPAPANVVGAIRLVVYDPLNHIQKFPVRSEDQSGQATAGLVGGNGVSKGIAYDPATHIIKFPVRGDDESGALVGSQMVGNGVSKGIAYDPATHIIKFPVRGDDESGALVGSQVVGNHVPKASAYDPADAPRTTLREVVIDHPGVGDVAPVVKRHTVFDKASRALRTTIREVTEDGGHVGVATGAMKVVVYDPAVYDAIVTRADAIDMGHAACNPAPIGTCAPAVSSSHANMPKTNRQESDAVPLGSGTVANGAGAPAPKLAKVVDRKAPEQRFGGGASGGGRADDTEAAFCHAFKDAKRQMMDASRTTGCVRETAERPPPPMCGASGPDREVLERSCQSREPMPAMAVDASLAMQFTKRAQKLESCRGAF